MLVFLPHLWIIGSGSCFDTQERTKSKLLFLLAHNFDIEQIFCNSWRGKWYPCHGGKLFPFPVLQSSGWLDNLKLSCKLRVMYTGAGQLHVVSILSCHELGTCFLHHSCQLTLQQKSNDIGYNKPSDFNNFSVFYAQYSENSSRAKTTKFIVQFKIS